jgi:hypothetical protein
MFLFLTCERKNKTVPNDVHKKSDATWTYRVQHQQLTTPPHTRRSAARLLPHLLRPTASRRRRSEHRPHQPPLPAGAFGGDGDAPPHHRPEQLRPRRGVLLQPIRRPRQRPPRPVQQGGGKPYPYLTLSSLDGYSLLLPWRWLDQLAFFRFLYATSAVRG